MTGRERGKCGRRLSRWKRSERHDLVRHRLIAGTDVSLSSPDNDTRELYRQLDQKRKILHTDKDGRFRIEIEGIVPDVKFSLNITQGRTFLVGEPRIGARQVKPGETLNLGDVRVKPGP